MFNECIYDSDSELVKEFPELSQLKGIVLNNLGMTERFKAIEWMKLFQQDRTNINEDSIKEVTESNQR